jgi:hypothetical protein
VVVSDREEVEGDLILELSVTSATSLGTEQMRAPTERLPPTREGPFITKVDEAPVEVVAAAAATAGARLRPTASAGLRKQRAVDDTYYREMLLGGKDLEEINSNRNEETKNRRGARRLIEEARRRLETAELLANHGGMDREGRTINLLVGTVDGGQPQEFCPDRTGDEICQRRDHAVVVCQGDRGGATPGTPGVHDSDRNSTESRGQVENDSGRDGQGPGSKRVHAAQGVQDGASGRFAGSDRPGMVGLYLRPEVGFPSRRDQRGRSLVAAIYVGWCVVSLCVHALWAAPLAIFFCKISEAISENFETRMHDRGMLALGVHVQGCATRSHCGAVCGRLLCVCPDQGESDPNQRRNRGTSDEVWVGSGRWTRGHGNRRNASISWV